MSIWFGAVPCILDTSQWTFIGHCSTVAIAFTSPMVMAHTDYAMSWRTGLFSLKNICCFIFQGCHSLATILLPFVALQNKKENSQCCAKWALLDYQAEGFLKHWGWCHLRMISCTDAVEILQKTQRRRQIPLAPLQMAKACLWHTHENLGSHGSPTLLP